MDDPIPFAPNQSPQDRMMAEIEALGAVIGRLIDKFGGNAGNALDLVGHLAQAPTTLPAPIPFKDPADRMEHGPTYGVQPPAGLPPGPPQSPSPNDPREHDERTLLEAINRGVWQLVQKTESQSARGTPGEKQAEKRPSPFQPLLDHLGNTRVGGIAKRLHQRIAPHVRQAVDRLRGGKTAAGKRTASGGSSGMTAKPAPKYTTRPAPPRPPGAPKLPVGVPVSAPGAGGAGAAAGEGAAAAGGVEAAAAAGPVGLIIAGGVALTLALVEAAKAGVDFAYGMEQNARKLAEVSPSQAANVTQLDVDRRMRGLQSGEEEATSSGHLLQAISKFEETLRPIGVVLDKIGNEFGAGIMTALSNGVELLKQVTPLMDILEEIAHQLGAEENKVDIETFGDWVKKTAEDRNRKQAEAQAEMERLRRAAAGF